VLLEGSLHSRQFGKKRELSAHVRKTSGGGGGENDESVKKDRLSKEGAASGVASGKGKSGGLLQKETSNAGSS